MKTTEEYLHILRNGKAYLMQYHIMRLGIFGSVAREIDVYFEADPMGLFTLGRLKSELETMLGCSVDLLRKCKQLDGTYLLQSVQKNLRYV